MGRHEKTVLTQKMFDSVPARVYTKQSGKIRCAEKVFRLLIDGRYQFFSFIIEFELRHNSDRTGFRAFIVEWDSAEMENISNHIIYLMILK